MYSVFIFWESIEEGWVIYEANGRSRERKLTRVVNIIYGCFGDVGKYF